MRIIESGMPSVNNVVMNEDTQKHNELTSILQSMSNTKQPTKDMLWQWGTQLIALSLSIGEQSAEFDKAFHEAVTYEINEGHSVSEATTRAKATISYTLKQNYDLYFATAKESIDFIKQFNMSSVGESRARS